MKWKLHRFLCRIGLHPWVKFEGWAGERITPLTWRMCRVCSKVKQ